MGLANGFVNAVGLQQTAIADAYLLCDMTVPPVGSEAIGAIFLGGRIDSDVIRTFELDYVGSPTGNTGITAAQEVGLELESEFDAGTEQCVDIPDLGLDGGEVGHVGWGFRILVRGDGWRCTKGGPCGEEPPFVRNRVVWFEVDAWLGE